MREKMNRAIPFLLILFTLAFLVSRYYGPKKPEKVFPVVPERFDKIREGDWFSLRHGDRVIRQSCTGVSTWEGKRLVRYRLDYFDADGNLEKSEDRELGSADPVIQNVNALVGSDRARVETITADIGGKPVGVYRVVLSTGEELWLSDRMSVNGVVRLATADAVVVEPVDFGRLDATPDRATEAAADEPGAGP